MQVTVDLSMLWAAVIGFGILMYVLLDGFDLGIGILFPLADDEERRSLMMATVAPVWDGNETWLLLGGTALFAAFPVAYAILLPALYLPLMVMLVALVLRSVAFEFRHRAETPGGRAVWSRVFGAGSTVAAFAQGVILGAFVQGFKVEAGAYAGGPFDWFGLFPILTGAALVFGYALLGATWLNIKTGGETQLWAKALAGRLVYAVLMFVALVSFATPLADEAIAARWLAWSNLPWLLPLPLLTAGVGVGLWRSLRRGREVLPFLLVMALFVLCYLGLAISLFPFIVPRALTIWEAAAPPSTQTFLIAGFAVLIPIIIFHAAYAYGVFEGKVTIKIKPEKRRKRKKKQGKK